MKHRREIDVTSARATIAGIDQAIAAAEAATLRKVDAMRDDAMSREAELWEKLSAETRALRAERESLLAALVTIEAMEPPAPVLIERAP